MSTAPSEDRLRLDEQVCFSLAVADRRVVALYRPFLEPLGLTHPQYLVMIALVGARACWGCVSWDAGSCWTRERCRPWSAGSRRRACWCASGDATTASVTVALTPAGRALRERARSVPDAVRRRLGLPEDRLDALRLALREVIQAAGGSGRGE